MEGMHQINIFLLKMLFNDNSADNCDEFHKFSIVYLL